MTYPCPRRVLMKSLPVTDPATLYRIGDRDSCCVNGGFQNDDGDFDLFSYELFRHLQQSAPEFQELAAFQSGHSSLNTRRGSGSAKSIRSEYVTGNYFAAFGVGAYLGRTLVPSDDVTGVAPVAVLSYRAWQGEYGSDPTVVGSTFYIQNKPVTIVGVTPPEFFGDRVDSSPPSLWIPVTAEPVIESENPILNNPGANWLYAIGRLKPGTNLTTLQEKLSASLRQWLATQPFLIPWKSMPPPCSRASRLRFPAGWSARCSGGCRIATRRC